MTHATPDRRRLAGVPARRARRWLVALTAVVGLVMAAPALAEAVDSWLLPPAPGEVQTYLLLGSDMGPPRGGNLAQANADGFQLLFLSADGRHASIVSVPRDAWVAVPGRGNARINSCLARGPERCVQTVESVFGLSVDGYVLTSMEAFKNAINALGGLEVDVRRPVYNGGAAVRDTGLQRLTGSQTLTYSRDRKNRPGGDFARSAAQGEVLALAHRQFAAGRDPVEVARAFAVVRRHTLTNIRPSEVLRLAARATALDPGNVQRQALPGRNAMVGRAAVVRLDPSAFDIVRDAARDGRIG
jgi:LCP family protein required for cell wall assembly